jgi:hypothetical protein
MKSPNLSELIRKRMLRDDDMLMAAIEEAIEHIEAERDLKNSDGFKIARELLDHIIYVTDIKKSLSL